MRYLLLLMCVIVIASLEFLLSGFWNAMKGIVENTHPVVAIVLLAIYLEIFIVAKKELSGMKDIFKKLWKKD